MTTSRNEVRALPAIDPQRIRAQAIQIGHDLLDLLADLVRQNSGSYNPRGSEAVLDLLVSEFEDLGFTRTRLRRTRPDWSEPYVHDLYASENRARAVIKLLHVGHVDTVFPKDNPFQELETTPERWHGPGVADMKGGLIVLLGVQKLLAATGLADFVNQSVVINSDEEIQSLSSRELIEKESNGCQAVLVYEPGREQNGIVCGRKGIARYRIDVQGTAAHAGNHHQQGRSAIRTAARITEELEARTDYQRGVTFNVGMIQGGTSRNTVPEHCWLELDVRLARPQDAGFVDQEVHRIAEEAQGDGVSVRVVGGVGRPPWRTLDANHPLLEAVRDAAQKMNLTIPTLSVGGGSDGNFTAAKGIPTLDGLGAVGGGYHSPSEWMDPRSIPERIALLTLTIHRLLSNAAHNV
jgi:glutamate carboxypeptidase